MPLAMSKIIPLLGLSVVVSISLSTLSQAAEPNEKSISISSDATTSGKPLDKFWSTCVGAGRANEALRSSWLEQMKLVHDECGFQFVRFHGLFHDDMFVYQVGKDGKPIYNWQYVDDVFDRLLAMGVRPFVEFGFNPTDPLKPEILSEEEKKPKAPGIPAKKDWLGCFWWKANAIPPSDNAKWCALVDAFLRHCIQRYGIEEVRKWYFEVWNEPNLDFFFHGGTEQKYFQLYKDTAQAVKKVDTSLRVGGPATSNFQFAVRGKETAPLKKIAGDVDAVEKLDWRPIWLENFLSYCSANKLPLDFISCHPYPKDFPLDPIAGKVRINRGADATKKDLTLIRDLRDQSAYPKAEIQLTEWSSSPSSRDFSHDLLPAATFVVKSNLDSTGLANSLSYWTFTDVFEEKGAGDTIFHGGFGLINYQGIVKPTYHAYRFLNRLGDQVLSKSNGAIITRHPDSGKVTALLYNYPVEEKFAVPMCESMEDAEAEQAVGTPRIADLTLKGLPANAKVKVTTLDKDHGNAVAAWKAMGSPEPPNREQVQALRKSAMALKEETLQADASGAFSMKCEIAPWSLVWVETEN